MKKMKKLVAVLLSVITMMTAVFAGTVSVSAASNPYGEWQTIGGVTTRRCTWYAWKLAYERTGVALPGLGNGGQWYDNAKKYGYSVGSAAVANCIAVWTDNGYGHVGYVESVSNGKMRVLEGGRSDKAYDGSGGIGTATLDARVGSLRNKNTQRLQGFIYLKQVYNVSYESLGIQFVNNTNAKLTAYIKNPSRQKISQVGAFIWDNNGNLIKNHIETCNLTYTRFQQGFDVQKEGGITLKSGTNYTCQFYAISGGKVTYSEKKAFRTTGQPPLVMGKSKITSLKSNGGGKMTVYWNKLSQAAGYQVRIATNSSFKNAYTYNSSAAYNGVEFSKLIRGFKYYVQVRAYWNVNGTKKYNAWSSTSSVRVKIL